MNYPKILKNPERILLTIFALCLLSGTACQAGSSSTTEGSVTQAPIALTVIASPPATQPMPTPTTRAISTEEITGTEAPVVETQVASTVVVSGQLPGKLAFIREDNLWLRYNGIEKQLTTDAIPTEIPYWTGLPKVVYKINVPSLLNDEVIMHTTLDIDEDVLLAAQEIAQREGVSMGKALSGLARQALIQRTEPLTRNGVPLFPHQPAAEVVTLELVNQLRDEAS